MENHHPQNRKGRVVSSHQRPHLPNNDTPATEPRGEARRREEKRRRATGGTGRGGRRGLDGGEARRDDWADLHTYVSCRVN